ncbi:MAG: helix-turn-helix transcriptional regulator [bacterium]|nr:helix-turn-helix transcriptional regulator [bacterium]
MAKLKNWDDIKKKWLADPEVKAAYDALEPEFQVASEIIKARSRLNITQEDLAKRIGTKGSSVSRVESPGYDRVSLAMLKKIAKALNCRLEIKLIGEY